jgi:predicted nucleic acid-binding protein
MPYLIDSNWLIDHLEDVPAASELLERLTEKGITISIISYMEAYQGLE